MKLELTDIEFNRCFSDFSRETCSHPHAVRRAVDKALELAAAKLPPPCRWISVAERMPEEKDFLKWSDADRDRKGVITFDTLCGGVGVDTLEIKSHLVPELMWLEGVPSPFPEGSEAQKFQAWRVENPESQISRAEWDSIRGAV